MRVNTGSYKGRVIKQPRGIRPTQDKVRKALFDILGDISGLSFLELFAGSGSVGLEAVSRGAARVVFVEYEQVCCRVIEQNLSAIRLSGYPVIRKDVFRAIKSLQLEGEKFDLIFLDPPYDKGMVTPRANRNCAGVPPSAVTPRANRNCAGVPPSAVTPRANRNCAGVLPSAAKKTLQTLGAYDILTPNGFIVAEHCKKDILPEALGDLILFKQSAYGDTLLSFYKRRVNPKSEIRNPKQIRNPNFQIS